MVVDTSPALTLALGVSLIAARVSIRRRPYHAAMPVTANQAAAAIREHLPHAHGARIDRLLYYLQGHHLAMFGQPAYDAAVLAGADGPTVAGFTDQHAEHVPGTLSQATMTAVVVVAARYGRLSTGDLNRLSQAETPWRATNVGQPISHDLLREFFTGPGRPDEPAHPLLREHNPVREARIREEVTRIRTGQREPRPDDLDAFRRKVAGDAR